jgi:release factor glutamine methyltransferase
MPDKKSLCLKPVGLKIPTAAAPAAGAPTISDLRRMCATEFRAGGIDSAELDARLLVGHVLGLDHAALTVRSEETVSGQQQRAIAALARRRLAHEPVARIIGTKEFWTLRLRLGEATLVPRPDTEIVVEAALAALGRRGPRSHPWRIADLGTGCGAILLALLSELPNAFGIGTDINAAAAAIATANAATAAPGRAGFVVCDMASALGGRFDLIVSNPPYVPSGEIAQLPLEVRLFDPRAALDGGSDGLYGYRALATAAAALLAPNGVLVVELGRGQEEPVAAIFAAAGLARTAVCPDLSGVARVLVAECGVR